MGKLTEQQKQFRQDQLAYADMVSYETQGLEDAIGTLLEDADARVLYAEHDGIMYRIAPVDDSL